MALSDDLTVYVKKTFREVWKKRDGAKVPETDDIGIGNHAVKLNATVLYADLAESTALVRNYKFDFAAEIYKTYLYCAARIIRAHSGEITAYDGDRVMAVFFTGSKNTNAAKTALKINYAVREIIQPALAAQYQTGYQVKQKIGVDTSDLFVARAGIRGSNDLVWIGRASNYAAKMAALSTAYSSYISVDVYNALLDESKFGGPQKQNMWTDLGSFQLGIKIYGSSWQWAV